MNIVVIDYARLAGEADFPPFSLDRYGWEQFPALTGEAIAERCWRADVVVTCGTALSAADLTALGKLKLIVVAGEDVAMIDQAVLRARGIALTNVPGCAATDRASTPAICQAVIDNIEAFLRGVPRNRIL